VGFFVWWDQICCLRVFTLVCDTWIATYAGRFMDLVSSVVHWGLLLCECELVCVLGSVGEGI